MTEMHHQPPCGIVSHSADRVVSIKNEDLLQTIQSHACQIGLATCFRTHPGWRSLDVHSSDQKDYFHLKLHSR
jgi:hypothetical protein